MRERILFAPGANSTELLRSLARKGINTFGLRVMNGAELARFALMHSGAAADYAFLSRADAARCFRCDMYAESELDAPIKKIYDTLRSLRLLIPKDEAETIRERLPKGKFREKNEQLLKLYESYMQFCDNPCRPGSWDDIFTEGVDHVRYRDEISVMRLAIEKAKPINAQIIMLKEFPLAPLERHLAEKLADGGLQEYTAAELFERENSAVRLGSITAAYGRSNEVEDIIGRIYEKKIPLDCCTVAVADTAVYSQLFYEYALRYDIPITFGCGVPITNSNPAKLLRFYVEWEKHGCGGIDALRGMIMSEAFDRSSLMEMFRKKHPDFDDLNGVIELVGSLKLGMMSEKENVQSGEEREQKLARYRKSLDSLIDSEEKEKYMTLADCADILAWWLQAGMCMFVQRFSLLRHGLPGRVDRAAVHAIGELRNLGAGIYGELTESAFQAMLSSSVCHEISCEGHLHITSISGALSSIRDHLFVAGMSAANFPGKPVENYLLLDDDYRLFTDDPSAPLSYNLVQKNKQTFFDLMNLAGALEVPVYISYSDADLASLKDNNPSSVLYEMLDENEIKTARRVGFFDRTMSPSSAVGAKYLEGRVVGALQKTDCAQPENISVERAFSPTNIEKYIRCPRMFYLNVILGLREPESDDATEIISAAKLGSLIHELMEYYDKGLPDYEAFVEQANRMFDNHLAARCPFNEADVSAARNEFIDIACKAYKNDPGGSVIAAELDVETQHPCGLKLNGRIDRVEKNSDEELLIVDYKTSRRVKHTDNDIDSCIQALLYAAVLEDNGMKVKRCEYRYLRQEKTVICEYNDSVREQLDSRLADMRRALETGCFPVVENDDVCRYCSVRSICKTGVK